MTKARYEELMKMLNKAKAEYEAAEQANEEASEAYDEVLEESEDEAEVEEVRNVHVAANKKMLSARDEYLDLMDKIKAEQRLADESRIGLI